MVTRRDLDPLLVRSWLAVCRGSTTRAARMLGVTPSAIRYHTDPEYRAAGLARTREANADPIRAPRPPRVRHIRRPGGLTYCGRGALGGSDALPVCRQCERFRAAYHR